MMPSKNRCRSHLHFWARVLVLACLSQGLVFGDDSTIIEVDTAQTGPTVSPLLFGDQIQWTGLGQDLLQADSFTPSTATLRIDVLDQLHSSGLTILRYPGGTLSDFFHWSASTGAYAGRGLQQSLQNNDTSQLQLPVFGADEFARTANYLGTEMMITADVGKGSASEAAAWLSYYKNEGITPKYWEIGNEVYLPGTLYPMGIPILDDVHLTALQYATAFDAYASALRAVDPNVQVGMVGVHLSAGGLDTWNQTVLQNVHQKIDFIAVHNSYAPQDASSDNSAGLYQAVLAYPLTVRSNLDSIEQDIATYAQAPSRNMTIAMTEHAALFTAPTSVPDSTTLVNDLIRSQSLGGALYSALLFHIYAKDPAVQIANHINPISPYFQALLHTQLPNISGLPGYDASQPVYPQGYKPNPVQCAYFHVFRLYADAGRGTVLTTGITNSPKFDSPAINTGSGLSAKTNVPSLDAMTVLMPAPASQLFLYVVNRDLTRSIPATVLLKNLSSQVQLTAVDQVSASDYRNYNTESTPSAVTRIQVNAGGLPGGTYTFPAYSLTRFTFAIGVIQTLSNVAIYPNPFRPAKGHTVMHFDNLPAGAHLRLYALAGEKVNDLTADTAGHAVGNGVNQAGQEAASGVYLVYVEGGSDKKVFKVAVQR